MIWSKRSWVQIPPSPKNVLISLNIGAHQEFPDWYRRLLRFFQEKSRNLVLFGNSPTVLSSPVSSHLFPEFFPNFLDWWDQKTLVSSRYRQFGNGLQSRPVSSRLVPSSGTQTSSMIPPHLNIQWLREDSSGPFLKHWCLAFNQFQMPAMTY